MHDAGGRADVGVGMAAQVFLRKIDQARFALQQGQQLQGRIGRRFFQDNGGGGRCRHGSWRRGHWRDGSSLGQGQLFHAGRIGCVRQGAEEGAESQRDTAPERWVGR
ncbi:hypothetical protein D3C72_2253130 [compost metagenome]